MSARSQPRNINYPPAFHNLRLFSTPFDHKLFFAGVYLSPIIPPRNISFHSQVENNGFACPHLKLPETSDTHFQHLSREQVFQSDFTPTNVIIGPEVLFSEKPVSPPRIDPTFEELCPLFSPLSEPPDDSALGDEAMGSSNTEQRS